MKEAQKEVREVCLSLGSCHVAEKSNGEVKVETIHLPGTASLPPLLRLDRLEGKTPEG